MRRFHWSASRPKESLSKLLRNMCFYEKSAESTHASSKLSLVSLPAGSELSGSRQLVNFLPAGAVDFLTDDCQNMKRTPESDPETILVASEHRSCTSKILPVNTWSQTTWGLLLYASTLCSVGVIGAHSKDDGRQSLTIVARATNRMFLPASSVALATSETISDIELEHELDSGESGLSLAVRSVRRLRRHFFFPGVWVWAACHLTDSRGGLGLDKPVLFCSGV